MASSRQGGKARYGGWQRQVELGDGSERMRDGAGWGGSCFDASLCVFFLQIFWVRRWSLRTADCHATCNGVGCDSHGSAGRRMTAGGIARSRVGWKQGGVVGQAATLPV